MATLARLAEPPVPQVPAHVSEGEYTRMCDAGVFGDDHVELNRGVLERMPPSGFEHAGLIVRVASELDRACERPTHRVLSDVYTRLARDLLRAPDVSVALLPLSGSVVPAANTLLAVEIADSSRRFDLARKANGYARAGIPHYWVVDVIARETHVMSAPIDGTYTQEAPVAFADPLAVPGTDRTIMLAD